MEDSFGRKISYLRISVTDRCNLRCVYCMPEGGVKLLSHSQILSFDQIVDFVQCAVNEGINKVRITGGEPLVRKGIVTLVEMLAQIKGIQDLSMTTNGILLSEFAHQLKEAGLHRINISLDTVNPERYREMTRGGELQQVLKGIEAAKSAGLTPIKINCVIEQSEEEQDAVSVKEFCKANGLTCRFIPVMNLEKGEFGQVIGGEGGRCAMCNRLRLTATGKLKPCLFSNLEYDILQLGYKEAIYSALKNKPSKGEINNNGEFYNIGG